MTMEEFDIVLDKLPFVHQFKFVGFGEPFLHPHIYEIISKSNRRGKRTTGTTNGTIVGEEDCVKMVRSGLKKLAFSIDSSNPDTFAKLRGGAKLEEVVANITTLVETKKRMKSETPRLMINILIARENREELKDIIELAHSLEVHSVSIKNLYAPVPELHARKIPAPDGQQMMELRELAQGLQVELRTFTDGCGDQKHLGHISVTAEGYVGPCFYAYYPDKLHFGNIFEDDFKRIWNHPEYKKLRPSIDEGTTHFCELCKDTCVG